MPKARTFEDDIKELEEIVSSLESGDAPLDEAVALFEKGMKLSKKCHERLDTAQQKIKILTENSDEEVEETDFIEGEE